MRDASKPDLLVGVIGTGAMGRGIMQVSAQGGLRVVAFDEKPGAAESARAQIAATLDGLAAKGRITPEAAREAAGRVRVAASLEDLADADLVVEAIVERLDIKQALFERLDGLCRPDAILASNTSSLSITAIAARCRRPERVGGLHFFNPVPLMKLVEVIPGLRTDPAVTEALVTIARRMTREPIVCTDSPGFVVNHIGRAYVPEASRLVADGIATFDDIDRVMTGAAGFRMGPFQLLDLVGADVSVAVMDSIWSQYYGEPMYAPSTVLRQRVDAGLYGQKSGAGWYTYTDGKRVDPAPARVPDRITHPIWVRPSKANEDHEKALLDLLTTAGCDVRRTMSPSESDVVVLTPVGFDVTTAATDLHLDPARTVAVDMLFADQGPLTLMVSPGTDPAVRDSMHAALAKTGRGVVVANDSPGFIAPRIVAHIVNVACQIAQRGIAAPADIDKGAKLGLGYPFGPLEWGDRIGPKRIVHILTRLHETTGEPRYRPSPWLKRRAALELSLLTPDRRS